MEINASDFLGGVGSAISIVESIYNSIKTEEYRSTVLSGLKQIEQGIDNIEKQLEELDKTLTYWEVWDKVNNPITRIDTQYENWDQDTAPSDKSKVCDDVNDGINQIYQAICGEIDGFTEPVISYYLQALNLSTMQLSGVENAFLYFNNMLLGKMLRGFSLLGAYKDSRFETWYNLFNQGIPNSNQNYTRSSYLKYAGTVCQGVIDTLGENFSWVGKSNDKVSVINLEKNNNVSVLINTTTDIPEGYVVTGIEFHLISNVLVPVLYYGELRDGGYVQYSGAMQGSGGNVVSWSIFGGGLYGMLLQASVIPADYVILDVTLKAYDYPLPHRPAYMRGYWFSIKCAKVVDGVIDNKSIQWMNTDPPELGASYDNNFEWELWTGDPSIWITPMTGVQILNVDGRHASRVVFRSDFHKDKFSLK